MNRDDWEKPRSRSMHLTEDEIAFIREGYRAGRSIRDVARSLKCSSRTVVKHYGFLTASGIPRGEEKPTVSVPPRKTRFYTSSFEPT